MGNGQRIIDGLKDAAAGNFSRVTIDGQVWVRRGHEEWRTIDTAPLGDDDFYLVCGIDDERSPFVVRGCIFARTRNYPVEHHLSLAWLTHWMPLPAKPAR